MDILQTSVCKTEDTKIIDALGLPGKTLFRLQQAQQSRLRKLFQNLLEYLTDWQLEFRLALDPCLILLFYSKNQRPKKKFRIFSEKNPKTPSIRGFWK